MATKQCLKRQALVSFQSTFVCIQSGIVVTQSLFDDSNSGIDRFNLDTASPHFKSGPHRLSLNGPWSLTLGARGATTKIAKKELFFHLPFAIPAENLA